MKAMFLAVAMLLCSAAAFADSTWDVTGTVTMTGAVLGPCGKHKPCVETLTFSALVTAAPFDFFGTPSYFDTLSDGSVTASGPLAGAWTVNLWQGYAGGYTGLYFLNSSVPYSEIDAPGFNSPNGLPQSFVGPAWFYTCAGLVCSDFGFQASGTQSITAIDPPSIATPEPAVDVLILLPLAVLLILSERKKRDLSRPND